MTGRIELDIPYDFSDSDKKAFATRYASLLKFNSLILNELETTFKNQNLDESYPLILKKLKMIMKEEIVIKYQLPFGLLRKELNHLLIKYKKGAKIITDEEDSVIHYLTYPLRNSCLLRVREHDNIVVSIEPYKSPFVFYLPEEIECTKEEIQDGYLNISYKPDEDTYRVKIS